MCMKYGILRPTLHDVISIKLFTHLINHLLFTKAHSSLFGGMKVI